jgi:hypothetical protein
MNGRRVFERARRDSRKENIEGAFSEELHSHEGKRFPVGTWKSLKKKAWDNLEDAEQAKWVKLAEDIARKPPLQDDTDPRIQA